MCTTLQIVVTLRVVVSDLMRDTFALALPQIMKPILTPRACWLLLPPEENLKILATLTVPSGFTGYRLFTHIFTNTLTVSLLKILLLIFLFLPVEVNDKLPVVIIEIMEVLLANRLAGVLLCHF